MDLFESLEYKLVLRDRIRKLKSELPAFTLAKVAAKIGLESTYVSRVLRSTDRHFSEDQLYKLLVALRFTPCEREYIFILRAYGSTDLPERKRELERQITIRRKARGFLETREIRDALHRMETALTLLIGDEVPSRRND